MIGSELRGLHDIRIVTYSSMKAIYSHINCEESSREKKILSLCLCINLCSAHIFNIVCNCGPPSQNKYKNYEKGLEKKQHIGGTSEMVFNKEKANCDKTHCMCIR